MIRGLIEPIGYYLSCMSLFNLIYLLSILGVDKENTEGKSNIGFLLFIVLLIIIGWVCTYLIMDSNDELTDPSSMGKKVIIEKINDFTGSNYFGNFSLIVLTSLSLSTNINSCSILVYIIILIALGVVYIKKSLFYMNPLLSLFNYSVYKCNLKKKSGEFIFVVRNRELKENDVVVYRNTNNRFIRLG